MLDEITASLEGASTPAPNQHQLWLNQNLDTSARFMGLPISGGICTAILPNLRAAEAALQRIGTAASLGIRTVSAFQGNGFHGYHSWGVALDINYTTNPYIMNEHGEAVLDQQLRPVFERICQFMIINDPNHPDAGSVIPRLGSIRQSRTVQQIYLAIQAESNAMKRYFTLMRDGGALQQYLNSPDGRQGYLRVYGPDGANPSGMSLPTNQSRVPDARSVQLQMESDWTVLTTRPIPQVIPPPSTSNYTHANTNFQAALPIPKGDRPFDASGGGVLSGRSPLNGYLDLSQELVQAMIHAQFRWGAIGFGPESGDIMHFDAGDLPTLTFKTGKTVGALKRAIDAWFAAHPPKKK
ncbi:MAG TPA: hypothetical protein VG675_05870 [Bryobacteraceae bacterium]|nr:hypothetical protein [Bryobacteraceae bacterium]